MTLHRFIKASTLKSMVAVGAVMLLTNPGLSAPPLPFTVNYDASYRGISAAATISLALQEDQSYLAHSEIRVRFLGMTASTINESSSFDWVNDEPKPRHYEYIQSGIGGRERSLDFNWENSTATARVDDRTLELELNGSVFDELSMYNHMRNALNQGMEDIYFDVIDRDHIEQNHYQVLGEEEVQTDIGIFSTLRVERIREDSDRVTRLWFSPEHDMLLIRLFQRDPDGDEYEITLENGTLNGAPLAGR